LLARTDRAYFRLTEDRATLGTLFLLDASASMDFPDREPTKWTVATRLAVGLAQVAHQSGDPVGILVSGSDVSLPLRARRGVVSEIATLLARTRPGGGAIAAELARRPLPPRVVILSDFLDEDPGLLRAVTAHAARGAEVHAVRVIAREEIDPPDYAFTAIDPESPTVMRPFDPGARRRYQARFIEWGAHLAARWRATGAAARWSDVTTDEPLIRAIRWVIGRGR
jgi:uncharacterized protein (DUF58 family)